MLHCHAVITQTFRVSRSDSAHSGDTLASREPPVATSGERAPAHLPNRAARATTTPPPSPRTCAARGARRHGDRRVACAATTPRTCAPRGARNDTALRTAAFCTGGARDDAGSAARCVRGDDIAHVRNAQRARRHRTFSAGGVRRRRCAQRRAQCVHGDDAARDDTARRARYAFAAGCSCALRSARDDDAQLHTARLA